MDRSSWRRLAGLVPVLLLGWFARQPATADGAWPEFSESPQVGSCTTYGGDPVTGGTEGNLPDYFGSKDNCGRSHCLPPRISLFANPADPSCDPWAGPCAYSVGADIAVPENTYRASTFTTQRTFWFTGGSPPTSCPPPPTCQPRAICGERDLGQAVEEDKFKTWISVSFSCAQPLSLAPATHSILTSACYLQSCQKSTTQVIEIDPIPMFQALCRPPRKDACPSDQACTSCSGPGGSVGVGGDGPGLGLSGTGPGATLRYAARGAGTVYTPGWQDWRVSLGRNWSHDYALRILLDPAEATTDHVWLITENATFREFWNPGPGGIYLDRSPSDEYRRLERLTGGGWILHELDGRRHEFDAAGRWTGTFDSSSSGNPIVGSYDALGRLETVTKPDGRSENFTYTVDGKLASITEVGVGAAESRPPWQYSWAGLDLRLIRRPDGTMLRFEYGDARHPGYLTRVLLVAKDLNPGDNTLPSERVLRGYSYDDYGNVVEAWVGATSFASGFERYAYSYDDPDEPTVTTVTVTIDTDPATSETILYSIDRPSGETKSRIRQVGGSCPACGAGANSEFFYEDPANPYRATRVVNGEGVETLFEFDLNGLPTRRVDAANNPDGALDLPRETTWQYHPSFPSFKTAEIGPTTLGIPATRRVDLAYDPSSGSLLSKTLSGLEDTFDGDGSFTPLTTAYSNFNGAAVPELIDPPGHSAADQTTSDYDPLRGEQLPLWRSDPLVGTTSWTYTPFNRVASQADPQGVVTETLYDEMNRVTQIARRGADDLSEADDLITRYFYTVFGELSCVKLPAGNGVESVYDAAGRLTQTIRGKATTSDLTCLETNQLRERALWSLDTYGHRKNERLERTTSAIWPASPDSETRWAYTSRCQLVRVTKAPDTAAESVTEYDYQSCTGTLTHVWDPNHPRALNPASTIYEYDALDRLTAVRQRWGGAGPATETTTSYRYDVQDHLLGITDAEGNETSYTYSDRDRMTEQVSPASGVTTYRYDEHGELVQETDARGISALRTVDAADRVDFVDYPGSDLDIDFQYGSLPDPVDFTLGRLTAIVRDPAGAAPRSVAYRYDRFGRLLEDGDLTIAYDKNGNRSSITLPGGILQSYLYDVLDRPTSLTADIGAGPMTIVAGVTYKALGPLSGLTFGSNPVRVESRGFDRKYSPTALTVNGNQLSWTYTTDPAGNILSIDQTQPESPLRTFTYQGFQEYLTSADGPWPGPLSWTYDRIGNRLTETRGAQTDDFNYLPNSAAPPGNSTLLDEVLLAGGAGGSRAYSFGPAGHLASLDAGANALDITFDAAGQLAAVHRTTESFVDLFYDGRGYLWQITSTSPAFLGRRGPESPATTIFTDGFESGDVCPWDLAVGWGGTECPQPPVERHLGVVYDSAGTLHAILPELTTVDGAFVFYLAGRPVALLQRTLDPLWSFVTTDHLGTPILALNPAGSATWLGGFEPFGHDWQTGAASASANGVFLRLPGQWVDSVWEDSTLGTEVFYNLHRWYEIGTGRYTKIDPLTLGLLRNATPPDGLTPTEAYVNALVRAGNPKFEMPYGYAVENPLVFYDPDGRIIPLVCAIPPAVAALGEALAATVTVLSATAAGVAVADWWKDRKNCDQCERDERDKYCYPAYLADLATCQARHGAEHRMRRACESAAAGRYASCLSGQPLPPLMP